MGGVRPLRFEDRMPVVRTDPAVGRPAVRFRIRVRQGGCPVEQGSGGPTTAGDREHLGVWWSLHNRPV